MSASYFLESSKSEGNRTKPDLGSDNLISNIYVTFPRFVTYSGTHLKTKYVHVIIHGKPLIYSPYFIQISRQRVSWT